jgi:hypothetical protein
MSPEEATIILRTLLPLGFSGVAAGGVFFLLLKYWLPGYLSEKGRNLASKEDIEAITEKVESVKRQHAELLEQLKVKNQLRLASLEQRLLAHQQAYGLWREINSALDTSSVHEVAAKCDKWWGENCLYLEPAARSAFLSAFVGARDLEFYKSSTNGASLVAKVRSEIQLAGGVIEECVALPRLNEHSLAQRAA